MLDASCVAEIRRSLRLAHRTWVSSWAQAAYFLRFQAECFPMSCSDCCQQEPDLTVSRQGAVAHDLTSWSDVEIPDQPPEMTVNGLGGMASLTTAFGMREKGVAADLSWNLYVAERIYTTDWEILRGISLRDSFRSGGSLWRNRQHLDRNDQVFAWCRSCQPPKREELSPWASLGGGCLENIVELFSDGWTMLEVYLLEGPKTSQ